jgi:hypothetical protein
MGGRGKGKDHKTPSKKFAGSSEGAAEGRGKGEEFRHARATKILRPDFL